MSLLNDIKDLEELMTTLSKANDADMREYLLKDKYHLYLQAKAHKANTDFWANRVRNIIERYDDEKI